MVYISMAIRHKSSGTLALYLVSAIAFGQLATKDHVEEPGFWPTKSQDTRADFAGPAACARCHDNIAASQMNTSMARTFMLASDAEILHAHPALTFQLSRFRYRIRTTAHESLYSIGDGGHETSYPLLWAFGTGRVAQSYLFRKEDGKIYESRTSYFVSLGGLDFTPGRALQSPSGLTEAMYRPVDPGEVLQCFACHATAAKIAGRFDENHFIPGVTCEACHGPGSSHIRAMDQGVANSSSADGSSIFNPAGIGPEDAVDFCGACHGTWWDVKLSGAKGTATARSAPYRLVTSKCWGQGDARLVCTACHDPHKEVIAVDPAYDRACLRCHIHSAGMKTTASHPGAACPKATSNCTNCHMEKVYVPEMHGRFTDHRIRIVKPGEPFPE